MYWFLKNRLRRDCPWSRAAIHPQPILVLGNQKSGTSAIAGLLAHATGLRATIDVFCRLPHDQLRIYRGSLDFPRYVRRMRRHFSADIVKEPEFTFLREQVAATFPQSRQVIVVRDPRTNIRSILNRLDLAGSVTTLPPRQLARLRRRLPLWYHILRGDLAGHEAEHCVESLAQRWNLAAEQSLKPDKHTISVRYEDFLADRCGTIERLASQLGLTAVHDIRPVLDAEFQPRNPQVHAAQFFSRENLTLIESHCAASMQQLGYARSAA